MNTTATDSTATLSPAAIAQHIDKALERSAEAGQASLRRAYGEDKRADAPKNLATAIKYARDAVRVYAGDAELPKSGGERRSMLKSIVDALAACEVLTERIAVEAARDAVDARNRAKRIARAAETQTKREQAEALNDAARRGDPEAAAEIVSLMAADRAERNATQHDSALARFARAVAVALDAGITVREMEAAILDAASAN